MDIIDRPAREIADLVRSGDTTALHVAEAFLERARERESVLRAFAHLDEGAVRQAARAVDLGGLQDAPLAGVPLGVKDVMDTVDMPTSLGSAAYAGRRPSTDASCVHLARVAGAVVAGKTVTTEFAILAPGPTTNPHNPKHTPGGSSSGSAAAVGAGILPLAFGTQTSGSLIRPSAFCGATGLKPSFGSIDRTGVKPLADSLDTIGLMARDVGDVALFASVMMRRPVLRTLAMAEPARVAYLRTPGQSRLDPEYAARLEEIAGKYASSGEVETTSWWQACWDAQVPVFGWEVSASLAFERDRLASQLHAKTIGFLDTSRNFTFEDYSNAMAVRERYRSQPDLIFGGADILICPSTLGGAPEGLDATGDPAMNIVWSLLGNPTMTIPIGKLANGLPVGLQLMARPGDDEKLLSHALWFERQLADFNAA